MHQHNDLEATNTDGHKRPERGTFTFPPRVTADATSVVIDVHELAMLLDRRSRLVFRRSSRLLA
jgi:hypothetical protein